MKYLSVCSGIEAATVAWHHLGWEPAGFAEVEKFPAQVLAHHYPGVPNFGDLTKHDQWPLASGAVDLLVGGTPCQAFSVAGLRRGMDDARGQLTLEFVRLAARLRPRWVVWENVPGVLSSGGGRDFGSFLGALGELGYGWAYRVLDAQYFGVAQRRRRVFVVGYLGDWRRAAAVLFERESVRRDSSPRGKAQQETSFGARSGLASSSADVVGAIDCRINAQRAQNAGAGHLITAKCITRGEGYRYDSETCNLLPISAVALGTDCYNGSVTGDVAATIGTPGSSVNASGPTVMVRQPAMAFHENQRAEVTLSDTAGSLTGGGGKPGQGYPAVMQPIPMINMQGSKGNAVAQEDGPAFTLNAMHGHDVHAVMVAQPIALQDIRAVEKKQNGRGWNDDGTAYTVDTHATQCVAQPIGLDEEQNARVDGFGTLKARMEGGGFDGSVMTPAMQVRRLTPVECERLQGFPDGYTDIRPRGKDTPDGPRYKALGNSMAVPVMRWIGERIAKVDKC